MLKSLLVKIFQQNMSLSQRNLKRGGVTTDLKLSNLHRTQWNSKHYQRAPPDPNAVFNKIIVSNKLLGLLGLGLGFGSGFILYA